MGTIYFNECKHILNDYKGSEVKLAVIYDNDKYMIKFPDPIREKGRDISYINNAFSEYIGCNIFKSIGIQTQETILGKYLQSNGKEKIVCACKDFNEDGKKFYEFSTLQLSEINTEKKPDNELDDILKCIKENALLNNKEQLIENFWEMFIGDSLISNPDRHTSNWGIKVDELSGNVMFAPVYDCGSSLYASKDNKYIRDMLEDYTMAKNSMHNACSAIKHKGKRINYGQFLKDNDYPECKEALLRIFPNIDIEKINNIIDSQKLIDNDKKELYKQVIKYNYEEKLLPAYNQELCFGHKQNRTKPNITRNINFER